MTRVFVMGDRCLARELVCFAATEVDEVTGLS